MPGHDPISHVQQWPDPADTALFGARADVVTVLVATSSLLHDCVDCAQAATVDIAASDEALMAVTRMRRSMERQAAPFDSREAEQIAADEISAMDESMRLAFAIGELAGIGLHIRRITQNAL